MDSVSGGLSERDQAGGDFRGDDTATQIRNNLPGLQNVCEKEGGAKTQCSQLHMKFNVIKIKHLKLLQKHLLFGSHSLPNRSIRLQIGLCV